MTDYSGIYLEIYPKLHSLEILGISDDDADPLMESSMSTMLYHFINTLSDKNKSELNAITSDFFENCKTRDKINDAMYDFVKFSRQGDIFDDGHLDMMFHAMLNETNFFEKFLFYVNNRVEK